MSNPWDPPRLPRRGDSDRSRTYTGVGMVTSAWESIEFTLSRLYSIFINHNDELAALREYGDGAIFRSRLGTLTNAAEAFFVTHSDQKIEAEFDEIVSHAIGFSERRNDVAHGMVFEINTIPYYQEFLDPKFHDQTQWAVIPPFHTLNRHEARGIPAHAYTSQTLNGLVGKLLRLGYWIKQYRNRFVPPDNQEEIPPEWRLPSPEK